MFRTAPLFSRPAQLWIGGLVLAAAGAFTLTAQAATDEVPHGGGPGGHMMMMGGPGGPGGMHGGPHMMGRMLDSVNATPEQRTQIRTIMQAAMTDMKALHANGAALRDQERQLFAQPNVDARAAETLRQQKLALHDQVSKRMLQAKLDAAKVLTPEQRKQMADRMAQRKQMAERHRAERHSLERPSK